MKLEGMLAFITALGLLGFGALGFLIMLVVGLAGRRSAGTLARSLSPWFLIALSGLLWAIAMEYWWLSAWFHEYADDAAPFIVAVVLGMATLLHLLVARRGRPGSKSENAQA